MYNNMSEQRKTELMFKVAILHPVSSLAQSTPNIMELFVPASSESKSVQVRIP